jgi:hypothetical protein
MSNKIAYMPSYLGRWDDRAHYATEAIALPCRVWLTSQFVMNSRKRKGISNIHGELELTHRFSRYRAWKGGWHHHGSLLSNRPSTGLSPITTEYLAGDWNVFFETRLFQLYGKRTWTFPRIFRGESLFRRVGFTLNFCCVHRYWGIQSEKRFSYSYLLLEFKSWDFARARSSKGQYYMSGNPQK